MRAEIRPGYYLPDTCIAPSHSADALENSLLANDSFFDKSGQLRSWRQRLDALPAGSDDRNTHLQWLFRLGLSLDKPTDQFYSFCSKDWRSAETFKHCPVCNKCADINQSWHCEVCRLCRHTGRDKTCTACGGHSSTARPRQKCLTTGSETLSAERRLGSTDRDQQATPHAGPSNSNVRPSIESNSSIVLDFDSTTARWGQQ